MQQPANATIYTFTQIAAGNPTSFSTNNGTNSFAINESGEVAFFRNSANALEHGVYTGNGGISSRIAGTEPPNFNFFRSVAINDLGAVAFLAN